MNIIDQTTGEVTLTEKELIASLRWVLLAKADNSEVRTYLRYLHVNRFGIAIATDGRRLHEFRGALAVPEGVYEISTNRKTKMVLAPVPSEKLLRSAFDMTGYEKDWRFVEIDYTRFPNKDLCTRLLQLAVAGLLIDVGKVDMSASKIVMYGSYQPRYVADAIYSGATGAYVQPGKEPKLVIENTNGDTRAVIMPGRF